MAMSEVGNTITVRLQVTGTQTAAVWREWARAGNRMVKRVTTDVPTSSSSVMLCEPVGASNTNVVGLLVGVTGSDYNLHGTVLLRAADVTLKGVEASPRAVGSTETVPTVGIKFNAAGEAVVNDTAGGFGHVLGGSTDAPRISFLSSLYTGLR